MIIHWSLLGILIFISPSVIGRKDIKQQHGISSPKCPMLTECPYKAEQCSEDDDCSIDSICCKSPCGKVCTKQLFTGCETLRKAANRRAKSLNSKNSVRGPRCNKSGQFEPIQCDNEIVSSCWCVDETGFELPGTRAPAAALVNCTAPKPCADHTCRMFCPHGFALDNQGCPLCSCRDPCNGIKCPNSLECQLDELDCADPPCPPIPTCKKGRSLENLCPVGNPLRISDTVRPFLCGNDPGKPTCPPMYQCLVQTGNDYGVCCPASLKLQKPGTCPESKPTEDNIECSSTCTHDLECPSVQKCCKNPGCNTQTCTHPKNVTECIYQRSLTELLAVNEREGRGYIPQCDKHGEFHPKQCSRNGLVCWCVDKMGRKMKGSMGAFDNVNCNQIQRVETGRSLTKENCQKLECAAVCEYGFKLDENGCHTCKCDDPCDGYICPEDEECINVKEASCTDFLCPSLPVCRPKAVYANPCERGTPLTDDISGAPVACALRNEDGTICPSNFECKAVVGSTQAVCCPIMLEQNEEVDEAEPEERAQTMCEYLRDFSESMEGTREGMRLALPKPKCDSMGSYLPTQCDKTSCWCVDNFGTEIPKTRNSTTTNLDCQKLRESSDCLDLTCRMGCEYGFILSEDTGCPLCQCRDPCQGVRCSAQEQCQLVEVNCKDHYCPPVPACLPKKLGQCPYLVPSNTISCDFSCNSDLACNGTSKCCSNGCGTQCVEPLLYTACQHKRVLAQHQAHESGIPMSKVYIPTCSEDGAFAAKQCNPGTGQCWCVDSNGFELSQTRSSITNPLECEIVSSNKCPMRKCLENCEHGYKLDQNGCRSCECLDPCDHVKCRGEGETCRLVNVECVNSPCPSVPMCLPKKENPCQNGLPLKYNEEVITCGPEEETCPSSHKCQLSPIGEYAVCCPKPRDICFEPIDSGKCTDFSKNLTRYHFNPRTNKCETFSYSGCQGNHNNFHTKDMCEQVCPVLSQCERLREKNQKAAEKYKKPTFQPRCESSTGNWQPVQCLEHVGVCWCVTPTGHPLKGSLTRGAEPDCNFRKARTQHAQNRADHAVSDVDLVLEELMMQIGSMNDDEDVENEMNDEEVVEEPLVFRCEELSGQCDENRRFLPTQCENDVCWCVDEAGNQLAQTNTFKKGEKICSFSPVEKVEITLGFRGNFDENSAVPMVNRITRHVKNFKGIINSDGISTEIKSDGLYVKFSLIGHRKIDIAYTLEKMVMDQRLKADITKSRVIHHPLLLNSIENEYRKMENREIVSQSPVSIVAPYHTALIVIAAASAFVISVLTLLVMLYRRKMNSMNTKAIEENDGLSNTSRPIYIELPNEKYNTLSSDSSYKSSA